MSYGNIFPSTVYLAACFSHPVDDLGDPGIPHTTVPIVLLLPLLAAKVTKT